MSTSTLVQQHGAILEIALNRPEAYNALNLEVMVMLSDALTSAARDESIKAILITGKGKAFCAGGDLKWVSQQPDDYGSSIHKLATQFHIAITEIRRMGKPVVAAINGIAAGGGFSLALACDFRVMAESAVLRQAYTSNGLSIDGGGTFILPRLVGLTRALEIAALDHPISSGQALSWGLVTKVVPDDTAFDEALSLSQKLAKSSLHSFAWSKRLLLESMNSTLETQLEWERRAISDCARHPEGREGINAFVEKRAPVY